MKVPVGIGEYISCFISLYWTRRSVRNAKQADIIYPVDFEPTVPLFTLVIGSDVYTSVYDKRDDFGYPIVNFPWLSSDVP